MAFKEVHSLECETTIALGGLNKKTGKPNPKQVEGYYIGSKEVESRKSKTGKAKLHIFKTAKGNLGVWGKTDLDRKMQSATVGACTRITQDGSVPTPNGDMYKYRVEIDLDNSIEVSVPNVAAANDDESGSSYEPDTGSESLFDEEETSYDEVAPVRPTAPRAASQPSAETIAKRQALLNGSRK